MAVFELEAEILQFVSRPVLGVFDSSTSSPAQQPDIQFSLEWSIGEPPIDLSFLEDDPHTRPQVSIGAHQYVDPEQSEAIFNLWPSCIVGQGKISSHEVNLQDDDDTLRRCLEFLKSILNKHQVDGVFSQLADQISPVGGYRRRYFASQMFDIDGNRRPSHSQDYEYSKAGDFIGPGVASLNASYPRLNELAWGRIIPYKRFAGPFESDPVVHWESEIRLHCNSFDELSLAFDRCRNDDIKGCVRSAASAVEAKIKYWCEAWGTRVPGERIGFDEKIERVLRDGNMPSYRAIDPDRSLRLLYLYRARNSIHEGDSSYRDSNGIEVPIRERAQVEPLLNAARDFCVWIDAVGWGWHTRIR